ncbi:MAG: response regulator [Acidimicrobiia bacterium]|nr:response regulator [Acidimicrobiia bacterium]
MTSLPEQITILVASDGSWIRDQVRLAFVGPGHDVLEVASGQEVRDLVAEHSPDLVILDLQIGNMGGIAVALDLHLEAAAWRLDPVPMILLLDREADRFLAQRTEAAASLVKPVDAMTLRRTAAEVLDEWVHPSVTPEPAVSEQAVEQAVSEQEGDEASTTIS